MIKILPEIISNQIAAGEVVNRPASVVKELMENAIDAGADNITLIIKDAGKTLIQVIDNGCGMDKEDAKMCFVTHATSKINSADDLFALRTMGFRGEALASIAAISFIELKTKTADGNTGYFVSVEGGQIKKMQEAGCEKGTSISVKNIFYNTPARRNFLKSDSVENGHITEEFIRIALFHKDISFSYYNNDKLIFRLEKTTERKRITDILGKSFNEKILPIEEDTDIVKIKGFVAKAELVRKNRNDQYFFVNGRYMRSNYFANAIQRAYQGLIPEQTYPPFVISLTVEPKNIDVNIHPNKTEIKFLDEKFIYSFLYAATKRCLGQFTLETEIDWNLPTTLKFSAKPTGLPPKTPTVSFNPNYNPFNINKNFDKPKQYTSELMLDIAVEQTTDKKPTKPFQIANKYIVVPHKESFVLINQQRASFKVLYEEFISQSPSEVNGQQLLFPHNHFFNPAHSFRLLEISKELAAYGFVLSYKSDGSFDITSTPQNLTCEQSVEAIEEIINDLENANVSDRRRHIAIKLAERLCIKNGEVLDEQEIDSLLSRLYATPTCELTPFNERVLRRISLNDIDALLK